MDQTLKERILFEAAREMNERGVKFTIDHVAAKLGISKKTLYQQYTSKKLLITAIVDTALEDIEVQWKELLESPREITERIIAMLLVEPRVFEQVNDWVYEDMRRYCPQEWVKIEQFRLDKLDVLAKLLDEGIAQGKIRPINTKVAAQMLFGAVNEFFNYHFLKQNNLTLNSAIHFSIDIFLNGVLEQEQTIKDGQYAKNEK